MRILRPEACPPAPNPQKRALPELAPDPAPVTNCERSFAHADLKLGAEDFDANLNRLLVQQAESVVIDTDQPFSASDPPKPLAGWLAEVQRTGGEVSRKAINCGGRGFSLFRALKQLFAPRVNVYAPAKAYDAVLWLEPESGEVTQVQFTRRVAGA